MKNLKKLVAMGMCLCMTALAMTGCASEEAETTKAAETAGAEVVTTVAEANEEKDEIVIGYSILSTQAEFLVAMVQGAEDKAAELGVTLLVKDCNVDSQRQQEQVEDLISQEVDAIIIEPWDSDAIITSVDKATEAGIPVFMCDTTANGGDFLCYVASDNLEMGRMGGKYIAEQLYERYGEYKGTVVNLLASLTSSNGKARSEGFMEIISQYPDIEVIERNGNLEVEVAMNAMTDILTANEKIDAVWCSGDNNAIAAIQAIEQANREKPIGDPDHIIIVSGDGGSEILADIRAGKCDACVSQQPITMGEMSVQIAYDYVVNGTEPASAVIPVDLYTITVDNIDSDEVKEFGIWADEVR